MRPARKFLLAALLLSPGAPAVGSEPAAADAVTNPAAPLTHTTTGHFGATSYTDAERLARAEAEIAALKRDQVVERAKPKWWEFACMGCLSITTVLLIIGALAL